MPISPAAPGASAAPWPATSDCSSRVCCSSSSVWRWTRATKPASVERSGSGSAARGRARGRPWWRACGPGRACGRAWPRARRSWPRRRRRRARRRPSRRGCVPRPPRVPRRRLGAGSAAAAFSGGAGRPWRRGRARRACGPGSCGRGRSCPRRGCVQWSRRRRSGRRLQRGPFRSCGDGRMGTLGVGSFLVWCARRSPSQGPAMGAGPRGAIVGARKSVIR